MSLLETVSHRVQRFVERALVKRGLRWECFWLTELRTGHFIYLKIRVVLKFPFGILVLMCLIVRHVFNLSLEDIWNGFDRSLILFGEFPTRETVPSIIVFDQLNLVFQSQIESAEHFRIVEDELISIMYWVQRKELDSHAMHAAEDTTWISILFIDIHEDMFGPE